MLSSRGARERPTSPVPPEAPVSSLTPRSHSSHAGGNGAQQNLHALATAATNAVDTTKASRTARDDRYQREDDVTMRHLSPGEDSRGSRTHARRTRSRSRSPRRPSRYTASEQRSSRHYDRAPSVPDEDYSGGRRRTPERAMQSRRPDYASAPNGRKSNGGPLGPPKEHGGKGGKPTHRGSRGGKGRNKVAPQEGSAAAAGSSKGTPAASQYGDAGPSNSHDNPSIAAHQSSSTSSHPPPPPDGPTLTFVDLPPDLLSSLREGPIRKRKRASVDHAARERSSKRPRWEDEFDSETRVWFDRIRCQATGVLKLNGSLQLEKESILRDNERLRSWLAEERWDNRVLRGVATDESGARWDFVTEEIRRLQGSPRDDSKRIDMYGDTDLSDASNTDDMYVRSEVDEGDEYVHDSNLGYGEWKRKDEGRQRGDASRSRPQPRADPPRSRPQPRATSPPRQGQSRAASPQRRPSPSTPRTVLAKGTRTTNDARTRRGAPQPPSAPAHTSIEHAASMDELVVEGFTIDVTDADAPDIHDADAEHALAAAEQDQRATATNFIARSLDTILDTLPNANLRARMRETLWDFTSGYQLPMPLGRYGHPHLKNWAWGEIDPRRIFKDSHSGAKLAKDSEEFRRLAREAVSLPFAGRSVTQRVVVGWAHRDGILPLPGWRAEPDIMHEARTNPTKVTTAVRRQNCVNRDKCLMYTDWDLVDIECMLLIRMSRPENVARALRQTVQVGNEWKDKVWDALVYGWGKRKRAWGNDNEDSVYADFEPVQEYENGPQAYSGDGSAPSVFAHLRRCGFGLTRLVGVKDCTRLEDSALGAYMQRLRKHDERRQELVNELASKYECDAKDLDRNVKNAYLSANVEFERIPEGRAIVRTCTKLARAHRYLFGQDGVLRYLEKDVITGPESMYSPAEIVRQKADEEARKNRADKKERWDKMY
ncbi:hypothetical protein AURDEDRAFT_177368 [Auricularia subglabra TFB-10046 SS5]|uniref:Uncharacterized protein n=1 Tax=Auricularia subglabra (strain TFB-10046 / SS5) TaxID=717982 RepID=J0D4B1_AURST|nr:hypothetical protein AURDEDRAFT_177368 [Auricularia subglabra TFB-10046 SS5]